LKAIQDYGIIEVRSIVRNSSKDSQVKNQPDGNESRCWVLKSLRDVRVPVELGIVDERNLLSADINSKSGEAVEANVPILRKQRLIIRNIPQDMTVEGFEENCDLLARDVKGSCAAHK
jgi:hypothetical protein